MPKISIARALTDRRLLGAALGDPASWSTWAVVLKGAFGMALDDDELAIFASVAGGRAPPKERVRELWAIVGRRGGKSRVAALIGVYLATCVEHVLAAGEHGLVLILAGSQEQARVVFNYAKAFVEASPVLRKEIVDATRWEIRLRNGVAIGVHANSFRTVRGRTLCGVVFDEVATWSDESSVAPDNEVYTAVLPALLTTRGVLIGISTGYKRSGLLYEKHRDHFGRDTADTLVVQGSTLQFNKTLTEADIAALRAADPSAAASEWDGAFRDDIASFLGDEMIDAAIDRGRPLELPPRPGVRYFAHCDAAGGAGAGDSFAISIGHKAPDGRLIVDLARGEIGRFNPADVVKRYAALLREYRVGSIVGDHFAAGWVDASFAECGIIYQRAEANASENYLYVVSLFTTGRVRLPDHPRLLRELRQLERHAHRGGRETVDHPRLGSDDFANVVAGVLRTLATAPPALWDQGDLLGDRVTVRRADAVFGVAMAGERGVGVVFFAYRRIIAPKLIVLDYELVSAARVGDVAARLLEWGRELVALPVLFSSSSLGDQFRRLGHDPAVVDAVAKDPMLAASAAMHVGAGAVKLSDQARFRAQTLPLGILDGTATDDDNPLRLAALIGIAVSCDTGRDLR